MGLTGGLTYKGITYGTCLTKRLDHYTFYPIYDWCIGDVWKAIHDNSWPYCPIYDAFYSYGIALREMRVSNVHHETAVKSLFVLQEIDPETWERLTRRLSGINTAGQLKNDSIMTPKKLPPMFTDWTEYRDYLLENLCTDETIKQDFARKFKSGDRIYQHDLIRAAYARNGITAILANDTGAKLENFNNRPIVNGYRRFMQGLDHENNAHNEYIQDAIKEKSYVR
jgi:predicted phosphoadenosine phosphosulfate sulfurtransferase